MDRAGSSQVHATDSDFVRNEASFGGAIAAVCYKCAVVLIRCLFAHNHARNGGGAIAIYGRLWASTKQHCSYDFKAHYNDSGLPKSWLNLTILRRVLVLDI